MKQFIVYYFLFLGLLFGLFYAPFFGLAFYVNQFQTEWILKALSFFLQPEQLQNNTIWINPQYKIIITKSCNGVIPILFLHASILAYPSSLVHKLVWMLLGYILFFIVNIVRILWVVFVTQEGDGHRDFYWSHDIVGNSLLMLTGLGLFVMYIKTARLKAKDHL